MPIYKFECMKCGAESEELQKINSDSPICCEEGMTKKPTLPAMIKIKGKGYPSRRRWCESWTPDSPAFKTGSLHGEKY